jgi:hypothetical protein
MTDLSQHLGTDQDSTPELCPSCQHPMSAHDRIGLRWCAATRLGVGQRDCVCSVAAGSQTSAGASWAQIRHGSAAR